MGRTDIRIDITNKKFGRLTVIKELPKSKKGDTAIWECICDCGKIISKTSGDLRRSKTISCGCIPHAFKHGNSYKKFYMTWLAMKDRCYNKESKDYSRYGGRGIIICKEWLFDYEVFHKWCEANYINGTTLDRSNNDGNYEPDNCRFATRKQQQNNRHNCVYLEYNGCKKTLSEWAEVIGIKTITLSKRFHSGWSIDKILNPTLYVNKRN